MVSRSSALISAAIVGLFIAGSGGSVLACGNAMIYTILFSKFPQAKAAYQSELAARRGVLYQVPAFPERPGLSYHRWSFGRATAILDRIHERLRLYAAEHNEDRQITIMLADEVYIAHLSSAADAPRLEQAMTGLRQSPRIDAYTTVNALGALDDGSVSWQQVLAEELIVPSSADAAARLSQVFGPLYGAPR